MVFDGDVNLIHGFFRQDAYPLVSGGARYRPIYKPVSRIAKRKAPDDASAACASASADVALSLPKPSTKDVVQRSPPLSPVWVECGEEVQVFREGRKVP